MALPPGRVRLRAPVAVPPVPVATASATFAPAPAVASPRVTGRIRLRPRTAAPVVETAQPIEAAAPEPVAPPPEVPAPVVVAPPNIPVDPLRSGAYVQPLDASGEPWSRPRPPAPALIQGPRVGAPRRPEIDPDASYPDEPQGPPCPEALHPEWSVAAEAKRALPF